MSAPADIKNTPLISIITPVYNTAAWLPRCMASLLSQTEADLEIILVDDGSPDNAGALCDQYAQQDARVRVIHQANAGASAAKNAGLALARGRYIGFVDSDDWVAVDMYAYLRQLLEQHQSDVAEIMLTVAYSEQHAAPQPTERLQVFKGEDILIYYLEHNEFAMGLRLYRRELWTDQRFAVGQINEDVVAGFQILSLAQKLVASNLPKYYYFSNPTGVSESPLRQRDMDLIAAGRQLVELTAGSVNPRLRQLALTKYYRAPFTLLVKMAVFGCSAELEARQVQKELQAELRPHFGWLLRSSLPCNRKILLIGCRFCYPLVQFSGALYRRIRRWGAKNQA